MTPVRLVPSFHEKVWGTPELEPWFPRSEKKIGEVWFTGENDLPLLVKFLFTSDKLSVQVHPDDEYARRHEVSRGKTEMWHILRAEPGARVALGFREMMTSQRLHQAALSGEIERLLHWVPVRPGDTYFVPAGTVHAIGSGIVLCEIQQNSDVTYRLYDYGRPRELHLENAIEAANLNPHPGACVPLRVSEDREVLCRCDYFITDLLRMSAQQMYAPDPKNFQLLIFLEGSGNLGVSRFRAGEAWFVPAGAATFPLRPERPVLLLRACSPASLVSS